MTTRTLRPCRYYADCGNMIPWPDKLTALKYAKRVTCGSETCLSRNRGERGRKGGLRKRAEHDGWYPSDPFDAGESWLIGYRIAWERAPVCAECGEPIRLGQRVVWVRRGSSVVVRLVHVRCREA